MKRMFLLMVGLALLVSGTIVPTPANAIDLDIVMWINWDAEIDPFDVEAKVTLLDH